MIVTVQETIEHSGEVTYASLRSYLERRGWIAENYPNAITNGAPNPFDAWRFPGDKVPDPYRHGGAHPRVVCIGARDFTGLGGLPAIVNRIERIALLEGRKPHEVLADIAEGR